MFDIKGDGKKIYSDVMLEIKKIRKESYEEKVIREKHLFKKPKVQKGYEYIIDENADYFSTERIAVYTCIIGNYDRLIEPCFVPDNCDFYAITDGNIDKSSKWKKRNPFEIEEVNPDWSPTVINRYYKMHPHIAFSDYRYSIYLDGNFRIFTDLTEYINSLSKYGMAFYSHPERTCVYEEIKACIAQKKDNKRVLLLQKEYVRNKGIVKDYGLLAGGIIARDHNNNICRKVMADWWEEYQKYSIRDQISLVCALFDNRIVPSELATLRGGFFSNCSVERIGHIS